MDAEEIKRIEDTCKIKSKEQFIQECENNNILSEWYSFTYDRSKPVSFHKDGVYYGKRGATYCSVLMTLWDVAFEKLIEYKKEYEWQQSGENFRIDEIGITTTEYIDYSWTKKLDLD